MDHLRDAAADRDVTTDANRRERPAPDAPALASTARHHPELIGPRGIVALQRAAGNRAMAELIGGGMQRSRRGDNAPPVQRQPKQGSKATKKDDPTTFKPRKATLEDVVKEMNGLGGPYADLKSWTDTFKTGKFLGHPIDAGRWTTKGVRPEFQAMLDAAEPKVDKEYEKSGNAKPAGYGITSIGGFRSEINVHGAGVAIDIDAGANPYIMHEGDEYGAETTLSKELRPVYRNIAEFILNDPIDGEQSIIPKLIGSGGNLPKGGNVSRRDRLGQFYDRLEKESKAMREYFRLMNDETALKAHLDGPWKTTHPKATPPAVAGIKKQMWQDYALLGGAIPKGGPPGVPDFETPREAGRPFHPTGGSQKDPASGFLTIPREVVLGLGQAVPRWGAIDFGIQSGDVMHFDDRYGIGQPFEEAKAPAAATVAAENQAGAEAAAKAKEEAAKAKADAAKAAGSGAPVQPTMAGQSGTETAGDGTKARSVQRQPAPTPPFTDAVPPPLIEDPNFEGPKPKPFEKGSGPYLRRPNEAWAYGPASKRKSANRDLATFVGWIKEVEQAYGPNQADVYQRLRRLYYSTYSGSAGAKFDALIDEREGAEGPPMTVKKVVPATLDGLYAIDNIVTPTGKLLDPTHIFAAVDVTTAGPSFKAWGQEVFVYGAPPIGIVTWTGDLASWWIEWLDRLDKLGVPTTKRPVDSEGRIDTKFKGSGPVYDESLFESVGLNKASKEDLFGDMDAQVIASKSRTQAIAAVKRGEGAPSKGGPLDVVASAAPPLSKLLDEHYGLSVPGGSPTGESNRFASFVEHATPSIPHKKVAGATGPNGTVELRGDAEWQIWGGIDDTARLIFHRGTKHPDEVYDAYAYRIRDIAKHFVRFLETGLKNGDAPWP